MDIMGKSGFTLLQMSLVFIIIGLITGGILTGRDLISTAAMRSQISQIDRYNTAVGTFQNKYDGLPGDLREPSATNFGFQPRGWYMGEGDGNGIIEGIGADAASSNDGASAFTGEAAMFWVDLSTAKLIDSSLNTATPTAVTGLVTGNSIGLYFPTAKIGNGNYIYVWSGGWGAGAFHDPCGGIAGNGLNYYGLSAVTSTAANGVSAPGGQLNSSTTLTVMQAYNIDKKIDDGLPQSGSVLAMYIENSYPGCNSIAWAAGKGNYGADSGSPNFGPTTAATPYATTNCYDNNNIAGTQMYSISKNANAQNCALSFQFQQ